MPPNIIIILADDLGYADIGVHGCQDIPTPNIDSLAARGFAFTNARYHYAAEEELTRYADRPLKIGSFWAASNVSGIVSDTRSITRLLHQHDALSFWDFAAAAPYVDIAMGSAADGDSIFSSAATIHSRTSSVGSPHARTRATAAGPASGPKRDNCSAALLRSAGSAWVSADAS